MNPATVTHIEVIIDDDHRSVRRIHVPGIPRSTIASCLPCRSVRKIDWHKVPDWYSDHAHGTDSQYHLERRR